MDISLGRSPSQFVFVGAAAIVAGCSSVPLDPPASDTGTTTSIDGTTTGEGCMPGQVQVCPCPNSTVGMQVCEPSGAGYGTCECDPLDTSSTGSVEPSTSGDFGTSTTGDVDSSTGSIGCVGLQDCAALPVLECQQAVCGDNGTCIVEPAPFDSPCGDQVEGECTVPDTCDNSGNCRPNHMSDGLFCSACGVDECTCAGGQCAPCSVFASTNNFSTPRSIEGWELTGSWGLYRQTPQSQLSGPSEFPGQVLGTDGNRASPFPGAEIEVSYARTPPTVLPEMIAFLSWNVDEGGGLSDNKRVRVSVDNGLTWDTLVDCAIDASWPFCDPAMDRDPGIFNLAQIPVPMGLQGQVGIVEFGYDSGDECCEFEKGWYIDSLNIATQCACSVDQDCVDESTVCGTGYCQANGECGFLGMPAGTLCGDLADSDCNGADTCDGVGYCRNNIQSTGLDLCGDCPGAQGCSFCSAGECLDCINYTDYSDFSDPEGVANWVVTDLNGSGPGWGLYNEAPPNDFGEPAQPFPNAPVYGTDGNRVPPYPGTQVEHSQVVTGVGIVPEEVTFLSWHVDEGSAFDTKRIEISTDDGATWSTLVDCNAGANFPFCLGVFMRAADQWDSIVLDTSNWVGQTGRLRLTYDTGDECCGEERGWFIDDLNFAAFCSDEGFPSSPTYRP